MCSGYSFELSQWCQAGVPSGASVADRRMNHSVKPRVDTSETSLPPCHFDATDSRESQSHLGLPEYSLRYGHHASLTSKSVIPLQPSAHALSLPWWLICVTTPSPSFLLITTEKAQKSNQNTSTCSSAEDTPNQKGSLTSTKSVFGTVGVSPDNNMKLHRSGERRKNK